MTWFLSPSPWCVTTPQWTRAAQPRKKSSHWLHKPAVAVAVALVVAVVGGAIVDDALSDTMMPSPMMRISAPSDAVALVAP